MLRFLLASDESFHGERTVASDEPHVANGENRKKKGAHLITDDDLLSENATFSPSDDASSGSTMLSLLTLRASDHQATAQGKPNI